ncbi:amino acid adenylation domain-containing protein [Bradyrhizobium sp. F1.4.3]|uniref:non-ribosomal peptide synthetase n=1 Tax=Bradyrhizobium sp. F1.4.3 TaxID=3156356 RepID=UPI0033915E1A
MEQVRAWNGPRTEYPRDRTVAQLFEEVVASSPNSIALEIGSRRLTYAELNSRANQLAHRLRAAGVGPETLVGCCLERSVELIVALVAVLKAGGAYVPFDPDYPKDRIDFLLHDTRTTVMVTQPSLASTVLSGYDGTCVVLDNSRFSGIDIGNTESLGGPNALAYVMYTSGSTGRPKGVMVENRAIIRLVRNTNFCNFGPEETFLHFAPISFDASTLEIWGALLNGGRLVVMPPAPTSLKELIRVIREHKVTTLWLTAGLFNLVVEEELESLGSLRQFLAGGDVLSPRHVRRALEKLPKCRVINGYGPTENTTFTCCYVMRAGEPVPEPVPIGRPISNTQAYILDEELRPVPPGSVGELFAAGDGLARGYLNAAETTGQKFLLNPFAVGEDDARMYRTGDLARWRPDGIVEFLGRADGQVKINGHRIEPGEIESALDEHDRVAQSCVVALPGQQGSRRLAAYYVSRDGALSDRDLREFLATKLPEFVIPALFVRLETLPLTPNGKVDRSALVSLGVPDQAVAATDGATTDLESAIFDIWRQSLGIDKFGILNNFFDLGGNSLLLVSVHASLEKALQITIPITALFEFTTIKSLAEHLSGQASSEQSVVDAQERARRQRAAFARQRARRTGSVL